MYNGESFRLLPRQPTQELFKSSDCVAFTLEAACPDEIGAIVDHVHHILAPHPVGFKWASKVYVPFRAPMGCRGLLSFSVRGSVECRLVTFSQNLSRSSHIGIYPNFPLRTSASVTARDGCPIRRCTRCHMCAALRALTAECEFLQCFWAVGGL